MDLRDLNQDQRLALVALIEATAVADRRVSADEEDVLADIISELGDEPYRQLAQEVDNLFPNEDALKTFLVGVKGQEARELIYGTVLEMAIADVVTGHEAPLLAWLGKTWNVAAEVEDDDQDAGQV